MSATVTVSLEEFDKMRDRLKGYASDLKNLENAITTVTGKSYITMLREAGDIEEAKALVELRRKFHAGEL